MIGHDEARMLASARADGELDARHTPALDEHLAQCDACDAFARRIDALGALANALPRERAPSTLVARIERELNPPRTSPGRGTSGVTATRRRRRLWLTGPAIAALITTTVLVVVLQPLPRFPLRDAGAAEGLTHITSFYVERRIDEPTRTTRERIWYQSPGLVRIERAVTPGGGATLRTLIIRRPGVEYVDNDGSVYARVNVPPAADYLPEPLSPALAFYGTPAGPGPVIAGRPTTRVEFVTETERRVAYVDAERFAELGGEEGFVVGKEAFVLEKRAFRERQPIVRKTTLALRYNEPIPASTFVPPPHATFDSGFRAVRPGALALPPRAEPRDFERVLSGTGPDGDAILYVRGALHVLVQTAPARGVPRPRADERSEVVTVAGRSATLIVGLYTTPRVVFEVLGRRVTISAPLPRDALVSLAAGMYPA